MKRMVSVTLVTGVLIAALTGCAAAGAAAPAVPEKEEAAALTVRIVNHSASEPVALAASYGTDGKTLGSKACEQASGKSVLAKAGAVEFGFLADELSTDPASFRIDVFAAETAGEDYSACGSAVIRAPQLGETYMLALDGDFASGLYLTSADPDHALEVSGPAASPAAAQTVSAEQLAGPWHLADDTDLGKLSDVFPCAAEFGGAMEIRSNGDISWYIGADGASGTYVLDGSTLTADVTGELDGAAYHVAMDYDAGTLRMTLKDAALIWVHGEGESLRGEG